MSPNVAIHIEVPTKVPAGLQHKLLFESFFFLAILLISGTSQAKQHDAFGNLTSVDCLGQGDGTQECEMTFRAWHEKRQILFHV